MAMLDQQYFEEESFCSSRSYHNDFFSSGEFIDCIFQGLDLSSYSFKNSKFINCMFEKTNLSNAQLLGASFRGVKFIDSKIIGNNFSECTNLSDINFERCLLDYCIFQELKIPASTFKECNLKEVDFSGSTLTSSMFEGSRLTSANFNGSNLTKCDFTNSVEYLIDPMFTKIKKAKFSMPEAMSLLTSFDIEIS